MLRLAKFVTREKDYKWEQGTLCHICPLCHFWDSTLKATPQTCVNQTYRILSEYIDLANCYVGNYRFIVPYMVWKSFLNNQDIYSCFYDLPNYSEYANIHMLNISKYMYVHLYGVKKTIQL